ncbi:hypothetical protein K488DRAFT_82455 [Vararia minispora EC-137]|uniref:Uncharacterized protein n=1 Tax=Vararia minispora EC-137 TaxID=1314806 RepID=A0ACB8QW85_9AGAM|nr:hypothetical protein K488DRAFT_82455 [Vararia minispora EC-137]
MQRRGPLESVLRHARDLLAFFGVPALFRWLSKKYPKIVATVAEEEEKKVEGEDGEEKVVPVDMSGPNPNEVEFDNLYLDMNGIVHPCTHPEGKPPPETEGEMMLEIFRYTERVVNMVRPRKLLFMAIDGVAPRAKMNQQRSRRFRSAQEAQDKEESRRESIALWEAMGKTISDEEKNKKSWDSNAITPGTPFMDFLAASLRYWVTQKMNSDPGWKQLEVIISDASVPGEGEHKIMDYIRRQRTNPGHNPNTRHVIYGLDADLIMLALATHEPYFKVLREDVFAQSGSKTACRNCGEEGHFAAQCTAAPGEKKVVPNEKKPFIFLDVSVLREYLELELNVQHAPFAFNLEQAIDDWVLLIFFVGNDFLPHLPSLEIREGAIDTLLRIWRDELPRMGGYMTNHGELVLPRAQIILEGLARREDDIFRRRREAEERQEANAKRRKIENKSFQSGARGPDASLNLTAAPRAPPNFAQKADAIGLGGVKDASALQNGAVAARALAGSNSDVVANRAAIRMANLSAAEVLKAEMAGLMPASKKPAPVAPASEAAASEPVVVAEPEPAPAPQKFELPLPPQDESMDAEEIPGFGTARPEALAAPLLPEGDVAMSSQGSELSEGSASRKRKFDEAAEDLADESIMEEDESSEEEVPKKKLTLKVNPDGTVEQEDTVRLWEPGYRERYYKQKFGVERSDDQFRKQITFKYIEGLSWVLRYYYQGTPSWNWYYPYHFAPFANDFEDVGKMSINFNLGQPFKPYEQLMGVFPTASRIHIPEPFHHLMTEDESPIKDFYPLTFDIDMNGKRMAWQGVALLPFIDEKRLLAAMAPHYPQLNEEEERRNKWGNNIFIASDEHPVYPALEALYGKKKAKDPVPLDSKLSNGISGALLPFPDFLPGSTYPSPLTAEGQPDIPSDRSLCALYFFPQQLQPHRSVLLAGVRRPPRTLTSHDIQNRGRGPPRGNDYGGLHAQTFASGTYFNGSSYGSASQSYGGGGGGGRDRYSNGGGGYGSGRGPPQQGYGGSGGYGGGRGGAGGYSSHANGRGGYGGANGYGGSGGYGGVNQSYARGGAAGGGYGGRGGYASGGGGGGYGGSGGHGASGGYSSAGGYSSGSYGRGGGAYSNPQPRGRGRGRGY